MPPSNTYEIVLKVGADYSNIKAETQNLITQLNAQFSKMMGEPSLQSFRTGVEQLRTQLDAAFKSAPKGMAAEIAVIKNQFEAMALMAEKAFKSASTAAGRRRSIFLGEPAYVPPEGTAAKPAPAKPVVYGPPIPPGHMAQVEINRIKREQAAQAAADKEAKAAQIAAEKEAKAAQKAADQKQAAAEREAKTKQAAADKEAKAAQKIAEQKQREADKLAKEAYKVSPEGRDEAATAKIQADRIANENRITEVSKLIGSAKAGVLTGTETELDIQARRVALDKQLQSILNQRVTAEIRNLQAAGEISSGTWFQRLQARIAGRVGGTGSPKLPTDYQTGGQFVTGKLLTTAGFAVSGAAFYGVYSGIRQVAEQAVALERNFALIRQQLEYLDKAGEFPTMRAGILEVSRNTGIAADQLAFLAYQMRGAFQDQPGRKGGIQFLNEQLAAAGKIARVTALPLTEVTDSLTGIATTFEINFQKIGDVSTALQARFGVLAKEIITFAADIGPVAHEAGASFEELATIGAAIQRTSGRSGAALAESLGRVLGEIQGKSTDILLIYEQLGPQFEKSTDKISKALGKGFTFDALEQIRRDFPEIQRLSKASANAIFEALGGRREAPTLTALFGSTVTTQAINKVFDEGLNAAGELDKAYAKVGDTLQVQFDRLKQSFLQLGVALAEAGIIPIIKDLASAVEILSSALTPLIQQLSNLIGVFNTFSLGGFNKIIEAAALVAGFRFLGGRQGGLFRPGPGSALSKMIGTKTAAIDSGAAMMAGAAGGTAAQQMQLDFANSTKMRGALQAFTGNLFSRAAATNIGSSLGGISSSLAQSQIATFSRTAAASMGSKLATGLSTSVGQGLGIFAVLMVTSWASKFRKDLEKDIDGFREKVNAAIRKEGLKFDPNKFVAEKGATSTMDRLGDIFSGFISDLTKPFAGYGYLIPPGLPGTAYGDRRRKGKEDVTTEQYAKYRKAVLQEALLSANERLQETAVSLTSIENDDLVKQIIKGLRKKGKVAKGTSPITAEFKDVQSALNELIARGTDLGADTYEQLLNVLTDVFGKKFVDALLSKADKRYKAAKGRKRDIDKGVLNQLPIDPESIAALYDVGEISYDQQIRQLADVEKTLQKRLKDTHDPKAQADIATKLKAIRAAEKQVTADYVANEIDYALKLRDLAGGENVNQYHLALVLQAFKDPRLKGTKGFEVREKLVADAYDALKGILQEQIDAASDEAEALAIGTKGIAVPGELQTQALALNIEKAIQTSSIKVGQLKKFAHIFRTGYADFINQVAQIMVASHLKLGEAVKVWAQARIAELQQAQKDINAALYSAFVAIQQAMLAGPMGILRAVDAATRLQNLGQKSEQVQKDLKTARETLDNLAKMQFTEPAPVADTVKGDIPSLQNAANDAAGKAEDQAKSARDLAEARLNYLLALVENDPVKAAEIAIQKADIAAQFAETEADRINAAADRIRAERQLREAQFDVVKAMGEYSIAVAELAGDSVKAAQLQLDSLQRQLAFAQAEGAGAAEIGRLQADILRQQREVENAILDVMAAQGELAVAIADAAGNTVEAARIQLETLQRQLQSLLEHGGAGTADAIRLQADIVRQQAALRDAALQEKMDTIDFNLEVEKISKQQAIAQYEALLSNADILQLTEQQRRDLILRIKQLKDSLNQDLQFNLPSELRLPTLYEARRLNQTGGMYQDNRTYTISLSSTDPASTQQAVDQIVTEINSPALYGSTTRIY